MTRIAKTSTTLLAAALPLLVAGSAIAAPTPSIEKCSRKLGVLAVTEPNGGWGYLSSYQLGSPAQLIRMMVQDSGCFDVVERGVAMANIREERSLAEAGEMRGESNIGKGQMQAADFVMTPAVQIAANNTGGVGGALAGGVLSHFGLGGITGGLKFKEASTSLIIADVRSSLQVAAAEGKATKTDFDIGGWGWTGAAFGAANGYTNTPEGKVIAASLLDNWNNIVRDHPRQPVADQDPQRGGRRQRRQLDPRRRPAEGRRDPDGQDQQREGVRRPVQGQQGRRHPLAHR